MVNTICIYFSFLPKGKVQNFRHCMFTVQTLDLRPTTSYNLQLLPDLNLWYDASCAISSLNGYHQNGTFSSCTSYLNPLEPVQFNFKSLRLFYQEQKFFTQTWFYFKQLSFVMIQSVGIIPHLKFSKPSQNKKDKNHENGESDLTVGRN